MKKLFVLLSTVATTALLAEPAFAVDRAPDPAEAQIETQFLSCMVPHHRSAVAMAQMALQQATHPELKDMAQSIIRSQNAEIVQMTQWLHDWYGMDPPAGTSMPMACMQDMMPMLHGRMPDMDMAMHSLQSTTGPEFEVGFLSDMSQHHAMAIMMSAPVLMAVYHRDLFTLAENIVISQGQEIRQMDEWLQSWYGLQLPLDGMAMATPTPPAMTMPTPTAMPIERPTPMAMDGPTPMDVAGH
jgi:uncharacterized protein (DUF305 family)